MSITGVINLRKEKGETSFQAVNAIKKALIPRYGKVKIGHAGTLDPFATGVLPVCVGRATKIVQYLQEGEKTYVCVMRLGVTTDTQDITGAVKAKRPVTVDINALKSAAARHVGEIAQTPPMYSAVKINGQRLYNIARSGQEAERAPRAAFIKHISVTRFCGGKGKARVTVRCGKGTYIRTLVSDIGEMCGCGACAEELARVKAGSFSIKNSFGFSDVKNLIEAGRVNDCLTPIDRALPFERAVALKGADAALKNGAPVPLWQTSFAPGGAGGKRVFLYAGDGALAGVYTLALKNGAEVFVLETFLGGINDV